MNLVLSLGWKQKHGLYNPWMQEKLWWEYWPKARMQLWMMVFPRRLLWELNWVKGWVTSLARVQEDLPWGVHRWGELKDRTGSTVKNESPRIDSQLECQNKTKEPDQQQQTKNQQRILVHTDSRSSGVICISHPYQRVTNDSEPWFFWSSRWETHLEPTWLVEIFQAISRDETLGQQVLGSHCCYCYLGTSESPGLMATCKAMASKGFQVLSKWSSAF